VRKNNTLILTFAYSHNIMETSALSDKVIDDVLTSIDLTLVTSQRLSLRKYLEKNKITSASSIPEIYMAIMDFIEIFFIDDPPTEAKEEEKQYEEMLAKEKEMFTNLETQIGAIETMLEEPDEDSGDMEYLPSSSESSPCSSTGANSHSSCEKDNSEDECREQELGEEEHPCLAILRALPQHKQRTKGWFEDRKDVFTASTIHGILNFKTKGDCRFDKHRIAENISYKNPYDSFRSTLLYKAGIKKKVFNNKAPLLWGTKYEEVVTMIYAANHNVKIHEFGLIKHKQFPNLIGASPDGVTSNGRLIEIKVPYSRVIDESIPLGYWLQMQMQLECLQSHCTKPLDGCDFVEGSFSEDEEKDWIIDATEEERGNYDALHRFNADGLHKGIIGVFYSNDPSHTDIHHEYAPLELSYTEKLEWLERRKVELFPDYRYDKTIWWSQNIPLSIKHVKGNLPWFKKVAMPIIRGAKNLLTAIKTDDAIRNSFCNTHCSSKRYKNLVAHYLEGKGLVKPLTSVETLKKKSKQIKIKKRKRSMPKGWLDDED
jgi:hypothetical protein